MLFKRFYKLVSPSQVPKFLCCLQGASWLHWWLADIIQGRVISHSVGWQINWVFQIFSMGLSLQCTARFLFPKTSNLTKLWPRGTVGPSRQRLEPLLLSTFLGLSRFWWVKEAPDPFCLAKVWERNTCIKFGGLAPKARICVLNRPQRSIGHLPLQWLSLYKLFQNLDKHDPCSPCCSGVPYTFQRPLSVEYTMCVKHGAASQKSNHH